MKSTQIVIAGDICPINRNEILFQEGASVFGDVLCLLSNSDILIGNLECPLIIHSTPIAKTGPNLGVSEASIRALAEVGFSALGLANNHIMDHGSHGLQSTIQVCKKNNISTFGAGLDLFEARRPLVLNKNGFRIGLIGLAEHEWSIAGDDRAGANPIDLIEMVRTLRDLKKGTDYIIVLLHGGIEGYAYPSPLLQKLCRFLIEEGVVLVVTQHSHCIGCYEKYLEGHIIYGQGNFIFDDSQQGDRWREGLLIVLHLDEQNRLHIEFEPVVQPNDRGGVSLCGKQEKERILSAFFRRSSDIAGRGFVEDKWKSFCREKTIPYMNELQGYGRIQKYLNRRNLLPRNFSDERKLRQQLNNIRCESHREVVVSILDRLIHDSN